MADDVHAWVEAQTEELSGLRCKDLRDIARREGVALGYDGATKAGMVSAIVAHRRRERMEGGHE